MSSTSDELFEVLTQLERRPLTGTDILNQLALMIGADEVAAVRWLRRMTGRGYLAVDNEDIEQTTRIEITERGAEKLLLMTAAEVREQASTTRKPRMEPRGRLPWNPIRSSPPSPAVQAARAATQQPRAIRVDDRFADRRVAPVQSPRQRLALLNPKTDWAMTAVHAEVLASLFVDGPVVAGKSAPATPILGERVGLSSKQAAAAVRVLVREQLVECAYRAYRHHRTIRSIKLTKRGREVAQGLLAESRSSN
jgi:DNA-binding PadR family transcriptional regulator